MQLPNDYEKAAVADGGNAQLPAGGYVCRIQKAEAVTANSGAMVLRILFDIEEGEYQGYYRARYARDKAWRGARGEIKWRGQYDTFLLTKEGQTNPFFKGLIKAVEESNPGVVLVSGGVLDEALMRNCHIGLVMGEEEFRGQDGQVHTAVRPRIAVPIARIREGAFTVPPLRKLPERSSAPAGFTQVDDDEALPF